MGSTTSERRINSLGIIKKLTSIGAGIVFECRCPGIRLAAEWQISGAANVGLRKKRIQDVGNWNRDSVGCVCVCESVCVTENTPN